MGVFFFCIYKYLTNLDAIVEVADTISFDHGNQARTIIPFLLYDPQLLEEYTYILNLGIISKFELCTKKLKLTIFLAGDN